jgi:hypothetical protein
MQQSFGFALSGLSDKKVLVNVGNNTAASNGGLDEKIELFITADSELKMSGGDSSHLEILGSVASQFEHLSGEVLKDSSGVDGGGGADSVAGRDSALKESVDSSDGELKSCSGGLGLGGSLRLAHLTALTSLASFASFSCHCN